MKLSKKITLFFILAILTSIFIVSLISSSMINNSFDKFLVGDQKKKVAKIAKEINALYEENDYKLYENQIESYATLENLSIQIKGASGNLLYSYDHMGGMNKMHGNMMMNHNMGPGKYVEESFTLSQKGQEIGSIFIGYIDNAYLTEGALIFKNTLTKILLISAMVAVTIGIVTSIILASSLTKPLVNIRDTALEMQKGNLKKKSKLKTNIVEIKELSSSINYLGETLSIQEDIRKEYASNISHELRTPLTTLKSHVEAIIDGIWEPSQEHLLILMSEINRLSSLVDDLKSSFNSNEHGIILSKTNFDLSLEIGQIITTFMPILNKENISLNKSIENSILVSMDKDKIKQVMYNLLSNAVKYTDKGGQISISLIKKEGDKVVIVLKDTGIGIPTDHLPLLFNRFYRVDESRNLSTGGTGLGLAIVKSIITEHGGQVWVESVYGQGSEFTISLPNRL